MARPENLFQILSKTFNGHTAGKSDITAGKTSLSPREKVSAKLQDNLDGLAAIAKGLDWPVRVFGKKTQKYACWYKLNNNNDTYELVIKLGNKKIEGLFGNDENNKPNDCYKGVQEKELVDVFTSIKSAVDGGQVDSFISAAAKK